MTRYNLHSIKSRRSYSFNEICSLLGVNRKTCHRWKKEGLKVIEERVNPLLVMGADLADFIRQKRAKNKVTLKEKEFFCMKCHKAVKAKMGSSKTVKTGKRIGKEDLEQRKKTGVCEACGTKINKYMRVSQRDNG